MRDLRIEGFRWVDYAKSSKNVLQKSKNALFYRRIGRKRLIDAFNPHQRSGLYASNRTIINMSWPLDRGWTLQINPRDMRYKTHQFALVGSRSDDRDTFLRVKSWPLQLRLKGMCTMIDRWSARPRDRRADFQGAANPTLMMPSCCLH